jgi:hypothetical protein
MESSRPTNLFIHLPAHTPPDRMWPLVENVSTAVDWFGITLTLASIIVFGTGGYFFRRFLRHAMREM